MARHQHEGLQHFVTIGEVDRTEAQGVRLDGKPADSTAESDAPEITFAQIRDRYLKTIGNGAVESNTLYTCKVHIAHLAK